MLADRFRCNREVQDRCKAGGISSCPPELQGFLDQFERLYAALKSENPYSIFISGDLNGHSELWWREGNTTAEGREIELLTSQLGLTQLIQEPTNFEPNKSASLRQGQLTVRSVLP